MTAGQQLAQALHAAIRFAAEHPEELNSWMQDSEYICALSIPNEETILAFMKKISDLNIKYSIFREPDFDNQITALALAPGENSRRLCSQFSLALKENK